MTANGLTPPTCSASRGSRGACLRRLLLALPRTSPATVSATCWTRFDQPPMSSADDDPVVKGPVMPRLATRVVSAAALSRSDSAAVACSSSGSSPSPSTSTGSSSPAASGSSGTLHLALLADMSTADPDVFYDIEGNTVIPVDLRRAGAVQGGYDADRAAARDVLHGQPGRTDLHLQASPRRWVFHDGTPFDAPPPRRASSAGSRSTQLRRTWSRRSRR